MYKQLIMNVLSQGERLKKIRLELNLSGKDFATPLGYSASYLYQVEKTVNIPVNVMEDVVREYSVNTEYLKDGIGEMFKGGNSQNHINYNALILDELKKQTQFLEKMANRKEVLESD